jgi:DNA invertase Pin-like site-specific DNA recombinase
MTKTPIGQVVGYARTSTVDQVAGLEAQLEQLTAAGVVRVFHEQVSSVTERNQLDAALTYVRAGDSFVVTKLDRLARSVSGLITIADQLKLKGVTLRILSLDIDTSTPTGQLMLNLLGAIGQFEREIMLERQREGIAKAKREGRYVGRQKTALRHAAKVKELAAAGKKPVKIAVELGISRSSVYRILGVGRPGTQIKPAVLGALP